MNHKYLFSSLLLCLCFFTSSLSAQTNSYEPNMLYIKYRDQGNRLSKTSFSSGQSEFRILNQTPVLNALPTLKSASRTAESRALPELSKVFKARLSGSGDMEQAAKIITNQSSVAYAEPIYRHQLFLEPNDPLLSDDGQAYLEAVNAPQAWDITTGSSEVVIGIIDTGTQLDHPDLASQIWQNPGETGTDAQGNSKSDNGIDDDNNGFVDDVNGWDFVGDDPGTNPGSSSHGTHVTGIAAAATDNSEGVASLGFNTRFIPIKVTNDAGGPIRFGFEAMLYAADLGVDIINASWGSTQFSQFGQDVVETVTEMGTLVISAAGNSNNDRTFFPAGYPEVIAVAAATSGQEKADFSSFGPFVDVSAPGNMILSSVLPENGGPYAPSSGTSMAAPVVAAQAALVKAVHPGIDPDQLRAQIIANTSPMNIPFESEFSEFELGSGFVQADQAIGNQASSIEIFASAFHDSSGNNNGVFEQGEIITAQLNLKNYGVDLAGADVTITSLAPETFPLSDGSSSQTISINSLAHSSSLNLSPVDFQVTSKAEIDQKVLVRLTYSYPDGTETNEVISTTLLPSFATLAANTIEVSVDGGGHIGFTNFPENSKGAPFIIRQFSTTDQVTGVPLLREGGLLFGNASENTGSSFAVSSAIRSADPNSAEQDFAIREPVTVETIDDAGSQRSSVVFTDIDAGAETYNMIVRNRSFQFNEEGHEQYSLFQYEFENRDPNRDYNSFRAGLFFDFDLPFTEAANDTAWYDASRDLIIAQNKTNPEDETLFIGATVAEGIGTPWIIDNARTDEFFFGIDDGFTEEEKWRSLSVGELSEGSRSLRAGPGNLSFVVGSNELSIQRETSRQLNFIIAYGFERSEMLAQINNARERINQTIVSREDEEFIEQPREFRIKSVYPNPFNPSTTISYQLSQAQTIELTIYDILGRKVKSLFQGRQTVGVHELSIDASSLSSGVYILQLRGEKNLMSRRKITLVK